LPRSSRELTGGLDLNNVPNSLPTATDAPFNAYRRQHDQTSSKRYTTGLGRHRKVDELVKTEIRKWSTEKGNHYFFVFNPGTPSSMN
jgi:hypothetical protein